MVQRRNAGRITIGLGLVLIILLAGLVITLMIRNQDMETQLAVANWQATLDAFSRERRQTQVAGQKRIFAETGYNSATAMVLMTQIATLTAWTPIVQEFNGVQMVHVPSGCFLMGGIESQFNEIVPLHEVCLPGYWIDRYEVTNAQFSQLNGEAENESNWTDPQRPREMITWFEARAFCELREARLPTEAEWEYAARGPDSLVFPWGNEFDTDNAVFIGNSHDETADVGENLRSQGQSWVGAYDMSGNVLELVSTIYDLEDFPYPYDPADGREDLERTNVTRVTRGGSFRDTVDFLAAYKHYGTFDTYWSKNGGFRCARSS